MKYILVSFAFLFPSSKIFACSCENFDLEKAVNASDSVYFAQAISAKIVNSKQHNGTSYIEAVMKVNEVLKGHLNATTKITTGLGGGDCGIPITVPRNYIIFSRKGTSYVGMCSGSKPVNYMVHYENSNELSEAIKKLLNTTVQNSQ